MGQFKLTNERKVHLIIFVAIPLVRVAVAIAVNR